MDGVRSARSIWKAASKSNGVFLADADPVMETGPQACTVLSNCKVAVGSKRSDDVGVEVTLRLHRTVPL